MSVEMQFKTGEPLLRVLNNALLFCSDERLMPSISAVRFESSETGVEVLATDRYRASIESLPADKISGAPFAFSLPRQAAKDTAKALKGFKRERLWLTLDDTEVTVATNEVKYTFQALDESHATFPDMRAHYPSESERGPVQSMGFNAGYLADLGKVRTAHTIGKTEIVELAFYGGGTANNQRPVLVDYIEGPTVLLMSVRIDNNQIGQ